MTDYRALIVDYGGVLTTPMQDTMIAFADELGIELQDLVRLALGAYTGHEDSLVTDFETGRISEDEFSRAFAVRLQEVTGRAVDAEGLVDRIFAHLSPEEDMIDLVSDVRKSGIKTALLSNSWGLNSYPRARLDALFDVVVISGEVGLRKPDPGIFELTTTGLGLTPAQCVFVDDHPGHLKAAEATGMKTVLHRNPEQCIAEVRELLGLSGSS